MTRCAAGCGVPLHPAARHGGHTTHPGCDPDPHTVREIRHRCVDCGQNGPSVDVAEALAALTFHRMYGCPSTALSDAERESRIAWGRAHARWHPGRFPG